MWGCGGCRVAGVPGYGGRGEWGWGVWWGGGGGKFRVYVGVPSAIKREKSYMLYVQTFYLGTFLKVLSFYVEPSESQEKHFLCPNVKLSKSI